MSFYSIQELEKLSGVKAHTIRIWEQRYKLLKPKRTSTNIRYYDDGELVKLLNVSTLLSGGMKISKISRLSSSEIKKRLDDLTTLNREKDILAEKYTNQLLYSGLIYDQIEFEKTFSDSINTYGLKNTYIKILYPLLMRTGFMWGTSEINPAQEHFISNLIRQKLIASTDALPLASKSDETWVLFLPEGEEHEIGLLFANYLLRQAGKKVVYLGLRVEIENLINTVKSVSATHLQFFLVCKQIPEKTQKYFNSLAKSFPSLSILVSGSADLISQIKLAKNISCVNTLDGFINKYINTNSSTK